MLELQIGDRVVFAHRLPVDAGPSKRGSPGRGYSGETIPRGWAGRTPALDQGGAEQKAKEP